MWKMLVVSDTKTRIYLFFGILGLVVICQPVLTKKGNETKLIDGNFCEDDSMCQSGQCCPVPGLEPRKSCYSSCQEVSKSAQILQEDVKRGTFQNRDYSYYSSPLFSWFDALQACCEDGGALADIKTQAELDFVISLGARSQVWTGGNDINTNGEYYGITDMKTKMDVTLLWAPGQPGGTVGESCLAIVNSRMHDYPCAAKDKGYVCVKDAK